MLTKMNIALAAALVVATSSAALAQSAKPNFANRQAAPARLHTRDVSLPTSQTGGFDWFEINRSDRASSPYGASAG